MKSKITDQKADALGMVVLLLCLVVGAVHFASGGLIG